MHTPEQFGQPADLHPDTLPEWIGNLNSDTFIVNYKLPLLCVAFIFFLKT